MTQTSNLGLEKPDIGSSGWGGAVNAGFDVIDKLAPSDLVVQHVHPSGVDTSSGWSWATAKKTILAAYDAVPNGGTILIAPNSEVGGEVPGQGIWLCDAGSLPQAGWRAQKQVKFIGISGSNGNSGASARVKLVPTGQAAWSGPWIWLDYATAGITFDSLSDHGGTGSYGIDMTRNPDGTDHTDVYNNALVRFRNIKSRCTRLHANDRYNPLRAVGCYWIWLEDACWFELEAETTTTLDGAQAAAIPGASESWNVVDGTPTDWPAAPFTVQVGNEDIRVTNIATNTWTVTRGYNGTEAAAHGNGSTCNLDPSGSIRANIALLNDSDNPNYLWRIKNTVNTWGNIYANSTYNCTFEDITQENCMAPVIHFASPSWGNVVHGAEAYDTGAAPRGQVQVSPLSSYPGMVTVFGAGYGSYPGPSVYGPATQLGGQHISTSLHGNTYGVGRRSYSGWGMSGFHERYVLGQHDTARRMGLSVAHHVNLASQDETTWAALADGTSAVTTGQADVFGLTRAAFFDDGGNDYRGIYSGSWNPSAPAAGEWLYKGDFVFFGAWMRSDNGWNTEFAQHNHDPLELAVTAGNARFQEGPHVRATGNSLAGVVIPHRGNLDWIWFQGFAKVSTGGSSTIKLRCYFDVYVCYPVLFTVASMTDAEAWEVYRHLAAYPDQTPAGSFATPRDSKLIARGGLGVGNSASASETIGKAVSKKIQVFDEAGNSLGYVPVYSSIT